MMKVRRGCIVLLIVAGLLSGSAGAIENKLPGARATSLSSAVVALPGIEGLYHNQAGLPYLENLSAMISYEAGFSLKELSLMAAGIVIPAAPGTFSAGFYRFGSGLYNSSKFGVSFSRKFGKLVSAAFQFDCFSERYPENSSPFTALTFEGGIITGNPENFLAGIHFFNPFLAEIKLPWGNQPVPRTVRVGSAWMKGKELIISSELEKTNKLPLILKTGVEFTPYASVSFRAGVSCSPLKFTGGAGFHLGRVFFDIAFSYYGNLGFTPSAGITFMP